MNLKLISKLIAIVKQRKFTEESIDFKERHVIVSIYQYRIDLSFTPGVNSHYLHPPFTDNKFAHADRHWEFSSMVNIQSDTPLPPLAQ